MPCVGRIDQNREWSKILIDMTRDFVDARETELKAANAKGWQYVEEFYDV